MKLRINAGEPRISGRLVWEQTRPSRLDLKVPLIDELLAIFRERHWVESDEEHWLTLCLDEVIVNGMLHGNEGDPQLPITLRLFDDGSRWRLLVEDQGEGFVPEDVPDPDDERSLMLEHGRGIVIMLQWLDELRYFRKGSCAMLVRAKARGDAGA
jgi:serine/threonine-protein kinase RsbW